MRLQDTLLLYSQVYYCIYLIKYTYHRHPVTKPQHSNQHPTSDSERIISSPCHLPIKDLNHPRRREWSGLRFNLLLPSASVTLVNQSTLTQYLPSHTLHSNNPSQTSHLIQISHLNNTSSSILPLCHHFEIFNDRSSVSDDFLETHFELKLSQPHIPLIITQRLIQMMKIFLNQTFKLQVHFKAWDPYFLI